VAGRSWGPTEVADSDSNDGAQAVTGPGSGGRVSRQPSRTSDNSSFHAPTDWNDIRALQTLGGASSPGGRNRLSRRPSASSSTTDGGPPGTDDNGDIRALQMQGGSLFAGTRPVPARRPSRRESRASISDNQPASAGPQDIRALQLLGSPASASGPTAKAPAATTKEKGRRTSWVDKPNGSDPPQQLAEYGG
jgi:hypothetical protein